MKISRIILASALAFATIATTVPAQAGRHHVNRNAGFDNQFGGFDNRNERFVNQNARFLNRSPLTRFEGDRVVSVDWSTDVRPHQATRARRRTPVQRAAVAPAIGQAVPGSLAVPEPFQTVAALPMGDAIPADLTGEFEGHADGLAYVPRATDVDQARAYLVKTATVGGTMYRLGRDLYLAKLRDFAGSFNIFGVLKTALEAGTIGQVGVEQSVAALHPAFALMAAQAIKTARANGLDAGLSSGYRPAGYGVGGFSNKFDSCHTYGLAGDFWGVGKNYKVWKAAAEQAGLYRPHASAHERNHWQAVPDKMCNGLRSTVTASGPKDLRKMWKAADRMIERGQVKVAHHVRHYRFARR